MKALTENKDNLASVYEDLETEEKKLVDAVYERPDTDIGEYWINIQYLVAKHERISRWQPGWISVVYSCYATRNAHVQQSWL